MRRSLALWSASFALTSVAVVSSAHAEGPRVAVLVTADEGLDPFVSAYAFEVASSVLRAARLTIAPPAVTSARLAAHTPAGRSCIAEPSCLVAVATDVDAPMLVAIELSAGSGGTFAARVTSFEVTERGPTRIETAYVAGTETAVAERVRDVATRLGQRPTPCSVRVVSSAGPARVAIDDARTDDRRLRFLSPGAHRLRIEVVGRASWRGEMTCRAGRRYRIGLR